METRSIDITDKQAVEMVLKFLKNGFPQSLYFWQFLTHLKNDSITKDSLWPCQLIVDDLADIGCVLFAYSSTGFAHHYESHVTNSKSIPTVVTCYSDEKHDDRLVSLIDRYVLSAKGKNIYFSCIEHRLSATIEQLIAHQHLGTCEGESYHMLELNKQVFEVEQKQNTSSVPTDIVLRPLTVSDATMINDLWGYRSETSLFEIMYEIEHFPTFGAYRDGELISWCLTKYDGSIGTVFTQPKARRLGLSSALNDLVASKLFEIQQRVYCFVAQDNAVSLRMFERLGYFPSCLMDWIIVQASEAN